MLVFFLPNTSFILHCKENINVLKWIARKQAVNDLNSLKPIEIKPPNVSCIEW